MRVVPINAHMDPGDCAGQRVLQLGTNKPHCVLSIGDVDIYVHDPDQLDDIEITALEAAAALREANASFEAEEQAEYEANLIREAVEGR